MTPIHTYEYSVSGPLDPFESYRRLAANGGAVLLDGSSPAADGNRHAYVLLDPIDTLRVEAGSDRRATTDPFAALEAALVTHGVGFENPQPGRFRGGAVGFLAYDLGRHVERLPDTAQLRSGVPDLWFGFFRSGLEIDLATGEGVLFTATATQAEADTFFLFAKQQLRYDLRPLAPQPAVEEATPRLSSNFDRRGYEEGVERVREFIRAGDVYQVNLSQRFEVPFSGDPASLYDRLRRINPAPFAAYLDLSDVAILSSSPERFLRRQGGRLEVRPIKGTRPRTGNAAVDAVAIDDLTHSKKDGAELAMIVDLERNDLGRVCKFGSVVVESRGHLEEFATVFHRVAVVTGELRESVGLADLLRATFPGGSITGAPKIRAMEVIEALEGVRRGIFTGSIGWIGFDGDLDLNIAIRTIVVERGVAHFHVGGGVVLDSDPSAEYDETLAKGKAMAEALGGRFSAEP